MRRVGRLSRVFATVGGGAIVTRTPNERDFVRHLETVHHIPAMVLASLSPVALAELHESEHTIRPKHAKPLWTTGPDA